MTTKGFSNDTNRFFHSIRSTTLLIALTAQFLLAGCASVETKDDSVRAILQKENALIERLQAERSQPEIERGVSENESLKKAEAHLSLALDELLNANKVIQSKILKPNQEEVRHGQNERSHD